MSLNCGLHTLLQQCHSDSSGYIKIERIWRKLSLIDWNRKMPASDQLAWRVKEFEDRQAITAT